MGAESKESLQQLICNQAGDETKRLDLEERR